MEIMEHHQLQVKVNTLHTHETYACVFSCQMKQ